MLKAVTESKHGQDLVDAVMSRDYKKVKKVLDRGADLNYVQRGDTALHLAARYGDKDIISALLRAGDSVNKGNQNGNTPLHFVARVGRENLIDYLIRKGADVNIQNEDGDSPLHASVGYQPMDVIERYVEIGMEVNKLNKNGDTPLHVAVTHSRDESVEALLLCKAEVNVANNQGKRAYELAKHDSIADLIKTYSLLKTAMESGYIRAEGTKFGYTDVKSPVRLKRVGITMESMSLDQNALATFYCRREKYENNSVNFVTDPEEEVLSDVYHFRIRDVIDEITATFTIPIYAEPSDKQEIVLKFLAGKGGTQVIKEHVKSDEDIFCGIETVLVPETTTVVVACLCTKKQSSVVGEDAQRINSEVADNFAIDIPEGAFEGDTVLNLKVFEHDQERADRDIEDDDGDDDDEAETVYRKPTFNVDESTESHTESVEERAGPHSIRPGQDERNEGEYSAAELDYDHSNKENIKTPSRKLRKRKASRNLLSDVFQINITGEQPTKRIQMQLPLSENATDIASDGVKVVRVNDGDGKDAEVLESETIVEGDKVTVATEHFSTFVLCPVKCTDLSKIVMDIQNAKYRRQAARFFVMVRMLEDEATHVLVVECIKSELSHGRRKHWRKKGFKKQKPKHTSKIMLTPSQEFFIELSGEARFDNSIGETGQRRLIFSPHRASFQPYQITLPTVYKDGKAGVHIFTSEKEENTVPDSPDKTESETLDDLKKVEVAQLKIKLKLPPEEDPFGSDVEEAFTHKTGVELRRCTLRSYWVRMKYNVMEEERQAKRNEQVKEHSRYLQKQKKLEEERALRREQTRLQSEKFHSKRTLFPTDILSSSMRSEDDD